MKKKITLFLMGEKGFECLKSIIEAWGADIIDRVYTKADLGVLDDYNEKIISLCYKNDINRFSGSYDNPEINTELLIAISWKWLIKTDKKLIVLHDSLFPKYKGIVW